MSNNNLYSRYNNYIYFGSYPQSQVKDSTLISNLTKLVGDEPKVDLANGFISYKYYYPKKKDSYYVPSNVMDYMWYKDIKYNNEKYRCIYFNKYRPYLTTSLPTSYFNYFINTYYFFKFEKVKWQILAESNGTVTILADLILDSQDYNYKNSIDTINETTIFSNNYEYSSIRKWLNDTFYNTIFNSLEQSIINVVEVDNNASTTYCNKNKYACENTIDKVWLLSYEEVFNKYLCHQDDRLKLSTNYAKSQGLYIYSSNGHSYWWLRSPYEYDSSDALVVYSFGGCNNCNVKYTRNGVVPALNINL